MQTPLSSTAFWQTPGSQEGFGGRQLMSPVQAASSQSAAPLQSSSCPLPQTSAAPGCTSGSVSLQSSTSGVPSLSESVGGGGGGGGGSPISFPFRATFSPCTVLGLKRPSCSVATTD